MTQHNPSKQDFDFIADLDASFGKKVKAKPRGEAAHKSLNKAFHAANPQIGSAIGKIPESELTYSWKDAKAGLHQPIKPEARVSFIVHQKCATCEETSWYTGHEYIRFQRRRQRYNILGFGEVETESTILRQLRDCDPELVANGLPNGQPLPQLIQEAHELVPRCPACILLERHCIDLWLDDAQRRDAQLELPEVEPALSAALPQL